MSLAYARLPDGSPVSLPGAAPFPAAALEALVDVDFTLPADDPWVLEQGGDEHAYVDAAAEAWDSDPAYMDVLDPESPVYDLKAVERDLYLHHWGPWLDRAEAVLDVGCGVGRFLVPLVARGAAVFGVDADLRSLRACAGHAAGLPGRVDLAWSSVHRLPEVTVDAAVVCEVLCYVPDAVGALREIVRRVRPGGTVLLSVEARWGWALSPDATPGTIAHALVGDGVLDLPGEGWTKTYEEAEVVALLEDAGLAVEALVPTHYVLDGPLEHVAGGVPELDALLDLEEACRAHPVWRPLNRIWTAVGVRPG